MADGAEREWLVYLMGPAGTIEVVVKSDTPPEIGNAEVRLGESRFLRETFAGAFPQDKVKYNSVTPASKG
ncbi:hypothetical protein [Longimicrobium sp.]|uniref:hypothetical protein n=1 Tax=Longimicrobium sp. TaxID=2029185 RepID=UPI003B3B9455